MKLKELGGQIAEKAYIRGERRLVSLIIVSYSMAKFLEKHYISESGKWDKFYSRFSAFLQSAREELREGDMDSFYSVMDSMVESIQELSELQGRFQSNIVDKARIKAGTQIYAHGASLSTAASFANVDKGSLASYINVTKLPDKYGTLTVKDRLKMAESLFGM
jgi:hypothetical protein